MFAASYTYYRSSGPILTPPVLVTRPGGLVLDPFAGSGSTGCACELEGLDFIGIEQDAESVEIAEARIAHWANQAAQMEIAA